MEREGIHAARTVQKRRIRRAETSKSVTIRIRYRIIFMVSISPFGFSEPGNG